MHKVGTIGADVSPWRERTGRRRPSLDNSEVVRLSPYIRWNRGALERPGRSITDPPSMSLLTTSIESTRLTRWNFGLVALTLLGVFAIALALMLPNTNYPLAGLSDDPV
jgi:hypothetical protein